MTEGCGQKLGPFDCCTVLQAEAVETMQQLPDACLDLFFADPPYNKSKADWDKGHDWREWIPEAVRVLKPNGAFWTIHDDLLELADIVHFVQSRGLPLLNWIIWDKYNDADSSTQWRMNRTKLHPQGKRTFDQDAEYLVYHADDGRRDGVHGFIYESVRAYLDGERKQAGFSISAVRDALGFSGNMPYHWFAPALAKGRDSQWAFPTEEHYSKLHDLFNRNNGHEYLRREYEDLRREYEHLRPTFNNPGGVSSVWQGPIAKRNGHPTPKPLWLLERIIEVTSNPGDVVGDFFMGSGTTAVAAQKLGRHFFGCDTEAEYVALANERLVQPQQAEMVL